MTIRKVKAFDIVCDTRDCGFDTGDLGGDFAIWVDAGSAEAEWVEAGCQRTAEGKHYCHKHINATCQNSTCEVTKGLIRITTDGDLFCLLHTPPRAQA